MTKRETLLLFIRILGIFYETARVFIGNVEKMRDDLRQEVRKDS